MNYLKPNTLHIYYIKKKDLKQKRGWFRLKSSQKKRIKKGKLRNEDKQKGKKTKAK